MLTTNMIRKDLNSQNMYDSGTALTGLACFINADLARDLANDVMTLVSKLNSLLFSLFLMFTMIKIYTSKFFYQLIGNIMVIKVMFNTLI